MLTGDEFTVLMLADAGESMIPIGRWKESVLSLTERGLMKRNDDVNYVITTHGRLALELHDKNEDDELRRLLEGNNRLANARTQSQLSVEKAAQELANAAKASALANGDDPVVALREWGKVALNRALELVNG